jgi:hypothetical protein
LEILFNSGQCRSDPTRRNVTPAMAKVASVYRRPLHDRIRAARHRVYARFSYVLSLLNLDLDRVGGHPADPDRNHRRHTPPQIVAVGRGEEFGE